MCNLYAMTANREAVLRLFRVSDNRAAVWEPRSGIFPGYTAPVIRKTDDDAREAVVMHWGFLLLRSGYAPKRVTNIRSDKAGSAFWKSAIEKRRCLVPATSYCEPHGTKTPAEWNWFALKGEEARPMFCFAGAWTRYKGPVKKDGPILEQDVYAFLTVEPNSLVTTIAHDRMPLVLRSDDYETWLSGTSAEAMALARSYDADEMRIVQAGADKKDLEAA